MYQKLLDRKRIERGLTLSELALRTGLGLNAVSRIVNGHSARPHRRTIELLADALHCTPTEIGFDAEGGES